ncbi:SCO4225 family membrane protein [Streptomyces axinellae]
MTDRSPRPVPRAVRGALRTVLARVYLAACAALLIWAVVASSSDSPDASLAGVVPLIATAPLSLVVFVLPDHMSMLVLAVVLGALVNALFIGLCVRALSRGLGNAGPRP